MPLALGRSNQRMRRSVKDSMTFAVLSVQPSPTTSSSKSWMVWARTERMAKGRTSARLCVGRRMLNCGALFIVRSPTARVLEFVGNFIGIDGQAVFVGVFV